MKHYPWHVFFSVCFRYALIGGDLTAQSTGSRGTTRELEVELTVEFKFQRRSCKLSSFPAPPPERPGELAHRLHVARSTQQSLATRTCCLERSLPNIVTVSALSYSTRVKSVEPLSHETGSTGFSSFFKTLYQRNFSVPTNT